MILNNFKFRIGSCNTKLIRWQCITKNCITKMYTDENNTNMLQHNHDEYSSQALQKHVINTACKRKAIKNISTRQKKYSN